VLGLQVTGLQRQKPLQRLQRFAVAPVLHGTEGDMEELFSVEDVQ